MEFTITLRTYDRNELVEWSLPWGASEADAWRCVREIRRRFHGLVHSIRLRADRPFDTRQVYVPAHFATAA